VAIFTAIVMVVFLGFLALAVDVGHLATVRNELQNAADASALAGARALFANLTPIDPDGKFLRVVDPPYCNQAIQSANATVNKTDSLNIALRSADIKLGHWGWAGETDYPLNTFTPLTYCDLRINSIAVVTRRNNSINGPISTWFARIFGLETVDAQSLQSVAAMGYLNEIPPLTGFPLAMNKQFRDTQKALPPPPEPLRLNPDGGDNAGWCAPVEVGKPNANNLVNFVDNCFPVGVSIGDSIYLNNGTVNSALKAIGDALPYHTQTYEVNGTLVDGWLVMCMVVSVDKFNQSTKVVDFQPIIFTDVNSQGNPKTIGFLFYPDPLAVLGGLSGGPASSLYATQPVLVQ
jgi:hypothetical protein